MARLPFQVLVYLYRPRADGGYEYALLRRGDCDTEHRGDLADSGKEQPGSFWQAIAGGGETKPDGCDETPLEAAQRETLEETGLAPTAPFLLLQTLEPIPVSEFSGRAHWSQDLYVVPQYCFGVLVSDVELRLSHEHTAYCWLPFQEAYRLIKYDGNRTALWELDCRLRGVHPHDAPLPEASKQQMLGKVDPTLTFLKLGGSLITDKNRPHTARLDVLERIAGELAMARQQLPGQQWVLGHGSGSFGHVPASRYGTRQGVSTPQEWRGFVDVWREAAALNALVMDVLWKAGLPAIALPPSAALMAQDGRVLEWNCSPIRQALATGLLPVIHGDVVFDTRRGGTILSTEDLFVALAGQLHPYRILLAGMEAGVWADFPACTHLLPEITPLNLTDTAGALGGSAATDVTGGMESKVWQMLALVDAIPDLEALIFSGAMPGNIRQALLGKVSGTYIRNR